MRSIAMTKKKQRRLRSGTFWKKFGIQRRTSERIAAVRDPLVESGIALVLDDGRFGHEKRSDLIILTCVDANDPIEKTQRALELTKFSGSRIEGDVASLAIPNKESEIIAKLPHITTIKAFPLQDPLSHFSLDNSFQTECRNI